MVSWLGLWPMTGIQNLGPIDEIMELPGQVLVVLQFNGEEVLIPLVDDLVLDLDKRKKKIVFAVPEGLI